jgi:riboflavin synthase
MFTGLIEANGRIERVDETAGGVCLRVGTSLGAELSNGDSIATSGVCLTVTSADANGFSADVSPETRRVTTLGSVTRGQIVNLERPLRADGRVGGHFVLGHVDGVGRVVGLRAERDAHWLDVEVPPALSPLLVGKGSVAIDGISLTVASLGHHRIGLQIVPYTWAHTSLRETRVGDSVNVEVDVLGKYVARLLDHGREPAEFLSSVTRQDL